jgi:hypothetical protein
MEHFENLKNPLLLDQSIDLLLKLEDKQYLLNRLTRSLFSTHELTRLGNAQCLLKYINLHHPDILSLLSNLNYQDSLPHNVAVAKLLAFQTILLSDTVVSLEIATEIFNLVLPLYKKSTMRTAATKILIQLHPYLDPKVSDTFLNSTISSVDHLWYAIQTSSKNIDGWKHQVLYHKNAAQLVQIIVSSHFHLLELHPVFSSIIEILSENTVQKHRNISLAEFWNLLDGIHYINHRTILYLHSRTQVFRISTIP